MAEGFREPACKVEINGVDYTDRFQPLVKTIKVTDKAGLTSDTCSIKLADPDGSIALPTESDDLKVSLGHKGTGVGLVFEGKVDEVRSTGTKGGGRELTIGAKGVDSKSKAKEVTEKHEDDATFGDVAKKWGKAAGLKEVKVDPELAKIKDEYWSMNNESFMAWGQRVAGEIGATFKIQGDRAIFVQANEGKTASGQNIPDLNVTFGDNLIKWDVSPVMGRPKHKKVEVEYYSAKEGKLKTKEVEIDASDGKATLKGKLRAPDEASAKRRADSGKKKAKRSAGEGTLTIIGDAAAKPEGKCILAGTRDGIDGEYRIDGVSHDYSKGGYTCDLSIKQPEGKAGKDSRRKKKGGAGTATGGSAPDVNNPE